jgi:hypothetical protein
MALRRAPVGRVDPIKKVRCRIVRDLACCAWSLHRLQRDADMEGRVVLVLRSEAAGPAGFKLAERDQS